MKRRLLVLVVVATASAAGRTEISASTGRGGTCSALLADGRSLITGGLDAPLSAARYFGRNSSLSPAASMMEARSGHICAALTDNTVLVAGGIVKNKQPTNSAEIFDPEVRRWTPTGAMLAPRSGAAAVLLKDGRVLVVGGEVDGRPAVTLEIYDPARSRFEPVSGVLSMPRSEHALAALENGRVLIAGGKGPGGVVLETTDIFDPASDSVLPGPRMRTARANFSATRLIDGRVLIAGGSDGVNELASTEIFDPVTDEFLSAAALPASRQGQMAIRIPDNGRVLIVGGRHEGKPAGDAVLYVPWRGVFEAIAPGLAGPEGEVIRVGQFDRAGKLISSGVYASPTIVFAVQETPVEQAIGVWGAGWTPGERVVVHPDQGEDIGAIANSDGRIAIMVSERTRSVLAIGTAGEAAARRTAGPSDRAEVH